MKLSRRSFMKANAVAAAAAAAGLSVPGVARAVVGQQEAIKWDKAPCRFAGRAVAYWSGRSKGVLWHARAIRMRRLTVGLTASKVTPAENHVRKRPFNAADAAHERRQISQRRRVHPD